MAEGGKNIDTGTGGYQLPDDDDLQAFDVGKDVSASKKAPYGKYNHGAGFTKDPLEDGEPKDLSVYTLTKLADYLSKQTSVPATGNEYPIESGEKSTSITDDKGFPVLQSPGIGAASNASEFEPTQTLNLSSLSSAYSSISSVLYKGKSSKAPPSAKDVSGKNLHPSAMDGNNLLPGMPGKVTYTAPGGDLGTNASGNASSPSSVMSIDGHLDSSPVVNVYQSTVMSQNRFTASATLNGKSPSSGGQFVGTSPPNNVAGFNPSMPVQKTLGKYDPAAPSLTHGQLAAIGGVLSMRAAGELGATASDAAPNSSALELAALLPGFAQLGLTQVSQQTLLASDVLNGMNANADDLDSSAFILFTGTDSWGNMNDVDDPYSGVDAIGMVAMSFVLIAGIELLFQGLSLVLGWPSQTTVLPGRDAQGRFNPGEYYAGSKAGNKQSSGGAAGALSALSSLNFGALIGIRPTNYPFATALAAGTNAFFQIPIPAGGSSLGASALGSTAASAATSSVDSPGFNSVVARTIIRSGIIIVDQLKKLGGSLMSTITQLLALIDVISSSKLIAACNIFAALGDATLGQPVSWADPDAGGKKLSAMDYDSDNLPNAVMNKNRLQGQLKLAWASNRAPANLILPSAILALNAAFNGQTVGGFSPFLGARSDQSSLMQSTVTSQATSNGRIDPTTAALYEQKLDAAYVPFYFHDLRTNEMVSFHAFLASITDDYTASYEKSEGFGRVEPVRIYKGTERKISLSFYVAATSVSDFDDMWVKINKLVTMVYPQYTRGVQLSNNNGSVVFTQPFSQLIGASPLIRIRLGDLIRSNYSPFALARLFGLGNPEFKTGAGGQFQKGDTLTQANVDAMNSALYNALANPNSETYVPSPGIYPAFPGPSSAGGALAGVASAVGALAGTVSAPPVNATEFKSIDDDCFEIVAKQVYAGASTLSGQSQKLIVGTVQFRTDAAFVNAYSAALPALTNKYQKTNDLSKCYIGGQYLFPASSLRITDSSMKTLLGKLSSIYGGDDVGSVISMNSSFVSDTVAFLDPKNNSVAQSFSDTGGKGLAGFIETMNFDWHDKVTWETQDGRAAPKICKVTIHFAPCHDISPGLDHMGFNRAPLYPVGIMGTSNAAVGSQAQAAATPAVPATPATGGQ